MKSIRTRTAEMQIRRNPLRFCVNIEVSMHKWVKWQEVQSEVCENLFSAFPTSALSQNIVMTNGCAIYISASNLLMYMSGLNLIFVSLKKFSKILIHHSWITVREGLSTSFPSESDDMELSFDLQETPTLQRLSTVCVPTLYKKNFVCLSVCHRQYNVPGKVYSQ